MFPVYGLTIEPFFNIKKMSLTEWYAMNMESSRPIWAGLRAKVWSAGVKRKIRLVLEFQGSAIGFTGFCRQYWSLSFLLWLTLLGILGPHPYWGVLYFVVFCSLTLHDRFFRFLWTYLSTSSTLQERWGHGRCGYTGVRWKIFHLGSRMSHKRIYRLT